MARYFTYVILQTPIVVKLLLAAVSKAGFTVEDI